MSALREALRARGFCNNWDMLTKLGAQGDAAIEYQPRAPGRLGWTMSDKTTVWSPFADKRLNPPKGLARTYQKIFLGKRKESWPAALAWAGENFERSFAASPFGGYLPTSIIEKARKLADSPAVRARGEA